MINPIDESQLKGKRSKATLFMKILVLFAPFVLGVIFCFFLIIQLKGFGIMAIGGLLIYSAISFIFTALLGVFFRKKTLKTIFYLSSFLTVILLLATYWISLSNPNETKELILNDKIQDHFNTIKSQELSVALEYEQYLHMTCEPNYIDSLILYQNLTLEENAQLPTNITIDWFPKSLDHYQYYTFNNFEKEISDHVFISNDKKEVYYFRLFW